MKHFHTSFVSLNVEIIDHPQRWIEICRERSTPELLESLSRLDQKHRWSLAAILAHLAVIDERRGTDELGYSSLFKYCTKALGYSEQEAYLRIRTARLARDYPRILTMIARGKIHLTATAKLAPHLDSENYRRLLDRASRRKGEDLDRMIAEIAPLPEKRPVIRALSVGTNRPPPALANGGPALPFEAETNGHSSAESLAAAAENTQEKRSSVGSEPEGRVLFHFAAGESLRSRYNRARELLWHKYPEGRPEQIFFEALEALLEKRDPDRRIARKEARASRIRRNERTECAEKSRNQGLEPKAANL